jgi:DNA-binding FadR family transcriptional regulator
MRRYPTRGAHGELVHTLGARVVSGQIATNEILNGDEIGLEFGVSRTVVREALKVLASKGLVESVKKLGTYATQQSSWNWLDPDVMRWRFENTDSFSLLEDLGEVRLALEPIAARLAALRRPEEEISAMGDAIMAMAQASKKGSINPGRFTEADIEFHSAIYRATRNQFLLSFSRVMETGLLIRDQLVHESETEMADVVRKHRKIFEAIVAREPEAAEQRMTDLLIEAAADASRVVKARALLAKRKK